MSTGKGEVTELLLLWKEGSEDAREQLIALVYGELRKLAARSLRSERSDHTLQPTALVHEAYQRLVDQRSITWQSRAHFFAVAASLMRRILVDHARKRNALRRGGAVEKISLDGSEAGPSQEQDLGVLAVDEALTELSSFDPMQAQIVELRFFGGLTEAETAKALGSSRATVQREWTVARAWLRRRLGPTTHRS